jgi:hypothetical protein
VMTLDAFSRTAFKRCPIVYSRSAREPVVNMCRLNQLVN